MLLSKARVLEACEDQANDIEHSLSQIEAAQMVTKCKPQTYFHCGFTWPHKTLPCPAEGKHCRKCGTVGHFAKVCKKHRIIRGRSVPPPSPIWGYIVKIAHLLYITFLINCLGTQQ